LPGFFTRCQNFGVSENLDHLEIFSAKFRNLRNNVERQLILSEFSGIPKQET
jgi:hypothetical protein